MFPIYFKSDMGEFDIQLIKNKNHTAAIETNKNEVDDPPINSLYSHG